MSDEGCVRLTPQAAAQIAGRLAEGEVGPAAGLRIAVIGGAVVAPDRGALEGITRKSIFELCDELSIDWRIGRITADDLRAAEEVFTTTTAGGVMPLARLDGRDISEGRPGPLSSRLRERYWQKHEEGWHATPIDYRAADAAQ